MEQVAVIERGAPPRDLIDGPSEPPPATGSRFAVLILYVGVPCATLAWIGGLAYGAWALVS